MKLLQAAYCPQCQEVFSSKEFGKNCPSCTNRSVELLYGLIWRKENNNDPANSQKTNPKKSIFASTIDNSYFTDHAKIVDEYYKRFPTSQQTAVSRGDKKESSAAQFGEGYNQSGIWMESKGSIEQRGNRADAGDALFSKVIRFLKGKSKVSCKKHNCRNNNIKILPTHKSQSSNSVV